MTAPLSFFVPGVPAPGGSKRSRGQKATNEEIASSYAELKSIYRVAKRFGMCPQSVHERLVKMGIARSARPFSDDETAAITELYQCGFVRGDGAVAALAEKLGRSIWVVYTHACTLGLCNNHRPVARKLTANLVQKSRESIKRRQSEGTYKNSMQGRPVSEARRLQISRHSKAVWDKRTQDERDSLIMKSMRTKLAKYGRVGNAMRPGKTTWKASWQEIEGVKFYARSRWEANYAHFLQWLKERGEIASWEHEPETFWFPKIKRGVCSYMPDFRVVRTGGAVEFHEVKGWMDPKSITKIKRMAKYHPAVTLVVIDAKRYRALESQLKSIVPNWQ